MSLRSDQTVVFVAEVPTESAFELHGKSVLAFTCGELVRRIGGEVLFGLGVEP